MTLRGEGNVHIGQMYGTPRCHVSRVADLVPVLALKTSKMLGSVSEGAVDEECMAEAK